MSPSRFAAFFRAIGNILFAAKWYTRRSHTRPINLRQLSSENQSERFICQYCFTQFPSVLPRSHAQEEDGAGGGKRERENAPCNSKFFSTRDEIWRSRVHACNESGNGRIVRFHVTYYECARNVSRCDSSGDRRAPARRSSRPNFENSDAEYSDFRTAAGGHMRGGRCVGIRNDKYAAMILQQVLIGQTASPSKRSTSCCAGWSILGDYNAPRTSYILNPPTLLCLPPPFPLFSSSHAFSLAHTRTHEHTFARLPPFAVIKLPLQIKNFASTVLAIETFWRGRQNSVRMKTLIVRYEFFPELGRCSFISSVSLSSHPQNRSIFLALLH